MWSRKVIKNAAKEKVKVNYWKMVLVGLALAFLNGQISFNFSSSDSSDSVVTGTYGHMLNTYDLPLAVTALLLFLVIFVIAIAIGLVIGAFLLNPLIVGGDRFFYKNIKEPSEIKELTYSFDSNYKNIVKTMFFKDLYTILWCLLFIVPGIVKSYEYRMIPYLLAENPNMSKEEAFAVSKRMMDGNKMDAFIFDLSFIGWSFLSALTLNIVGIFYYFPYYYQSCAMLYDAIKIQDANRMQYNQNPNGFNQAPNNGFNQAPNNGFNQAPNNGFNQAPNNGFNQTPNNGFNQAPNNGFNQAPNNDPNQAPDENQNNEAGQTNNNWEQSDWSKKDF
ncbi:MAG: DUF975 family protein [Lachnospiraceae bacterium]|nr:DUF975 family protein [Lachnospiraceae bacterium]